MRLPSRQPSLVEGVNELMGANRNRLNEPVQELVLRVS